mgnify:FL=1|jgi:hypothetical protein
MPRGRIGALSRKTYFPGTGDQLEDPREGVVWECVRSNTFSEGDDTVRYGLLRGAMSGDDDTIYEPITSTDKGWLLGVETIRRKVEGGKFRTYNWTEETGTWRQLKE